MTNTRRILLFCTLLVCALMIGGCKKKETKEEQEQKYIFYSEITQEDWDTAAFVDKESDYEFTLMEEMNSENDFQYLDVPNLYGGHSDDMLVDSQGTKITEEDKVFRYMIILREPSDHHILGIHVGDTYGDARTRIEGEGFVWDSSEVIYGNHTVTLFKKGNVWIRVCSTNTGSTVSDEDLIDTISAMIPIRDESDIPFDGDY